MPHDSLEAYVTVQKSIQDYRVEIEKKKHLLPPPEGRDPKSHERMLTCARYILGPFTDPWSQGFGHKGRSIRASHFEFLRKPEGFDNEKRFAVGTIRAAMKALGIRTFRKKGCLWWSHPRYTYDEVIGNLKAVYSSDQKRNLKAMKEIRTIEQKIAVRQGPSGRALMEIMEAHDYDGLQKDIEIEFKKTFSESSFVTAKTALGIASIHLKIENERHYLWTGPPVITWLRQKINAANGQGVMEEDLINAGARKNWSPLLIRTTLEKIVGREDYNDKGDPVWFNRPPSL